MNLEFHTATSVDAEGAYFFNKYVGVGGRLRVRAMTAKGWGDFISQAQMDCDNYIESVYDLYSTLRPGEDIMPADDFYQKLDGMISNEEITVESDHLTEFSANVGLYLNLPISKRFALSTKLLIGRTMTQELDINAHYEGTQKAMDSHIVIDNGSLTDLSLDNIRDGEDYDVDWDYLTLGGNHSTQFTTGLSLTYKYKANFSWRVFADYDYSQKEFTLRADPYRFLHHATPKLGSIFQALGSNLNPIEFKKKRDLHFFTIGGSFLVNF
jgi:hypothetical protein